MKLLLDSCTLLWAALDDTSLSEKSKRLLLDPANERFVSVASFWEVIVKIHIGKLNLPSPTKEFFELCINELSLQVVSLDQASIMRLLDLPELHKDPFDRAIIVTAIEHELTILTPDKAIRQYGVRTEW